MRTSLVVLALFLASSLAATPTITSVSPTFGVAGGGTSVTITGTGFATCPICSPPLPPAVLFGATPAASVTLVNETTIVAVTPPHQAATVAVTVDQYDGQATLPNAYTFTGDMFAALEPILVPVFSPPLFGAHGSEFRTKVAVAHKGGSQSTSRVLLFGRDTSCFTFSPVLGPFTPLALEPHGIPLDLPPDCSTSTGRLFYVPAGQAKDIAFNARVRDVSRSDVSHGTEIPVVRWSEFTDETIALLNVPLDARFRNTLRIYALEPTGVEMIVGTTHYFVQLQPGANEFEPAYAMFTDFEIDPAVPQTTRVTLRAISPITTPPSPIHPIWAFISVTNNASQEITTITPH